MNGRQLEDDLFEICVEYGADRGVDFRILARLMRIIAERMLITSEWEQGD
jgi:hypothetical protein